MCVQEINLGLLCHTALAWLFPWGWATTWQIRNWSRQLTLCGPSACINNYHPLKRWVLAVCCSFLHCHWPGSAGYLPTVLPWRYPAQTHSPSLPWNPLGSCWEVCWSNACWFLAVGGGTTKACVFLPEAICFCVRRCLWVQNSLRYVFSSCIGMESVSVVCKGPRNSWHNVKNRFAFLVWLLVWQCASLLFVNHLVWGFIWFYFKP